MGKNIHIENECPFQISQFFGFCNMELYSLPVRDSSVFPIDIVITFRPLNANEWFDQAMIKLSCLYGLIESKLC